eukprot:jgi/Chrzof1/7561/Cz02g28140.t1
MRLFQACMYRKMDIAQRANQLQQLAFQLDVLEGICVGPYIAGTSITSGDSALFPTFVFMNHILPKYFGWSSVFAGRPKLEGWWAAMQQDPHAAKVISEVQGGLDGWTGNKRWEELGIVEQIANKDFKWAY